VAWGLFSASGSIMSAGGMFTKRMPALKKMAAGGFANFAQNYQIGEAGREAIVPWIAHSIRVDPAVRFCQPRAR